MNKSLDIKFRSEWSHPKWKKQFNAYCKTVGNAKLTAAAEYNLNKLRFICALGVLFAVNWLYFILGLTPVTIIKNLASGSGFIYAVAVIAFVVYPSLIYGGYTFWLNRAVPRKFKKPDHSKVLKLDETIPVSQAPDPRDGNFPIGVDEKGEFVFWNFDGKYYRPNVIFTGQADLFGKEHIFNVFIRGVLAAETDVIFLVYDQDRGWDFSWLKKNYSSLLDKKYIDTWDSEDWMYELAQLPRLPNVAVFEGNEIYRSLRWLEDELDRRQMIKAKTPGVYFPVRIVAILDSELTSELKNKDSRFLVLRSVLQAHPEIKLNLLGVSKPNMAWTDLGDLVQYTSGIQFFNSAQFESKNGKEKDKDTPEGGEKPKAMQRSFDVAPMQFKCKLWRRGAGQVMSLLSCESAELAEFIYQQAGNDQDETFQLWKAASSFTGREVLVNLREPE